jgi:predicted nucleic acid-binding protein
MSDIVVDSSVVAKWVLPEADSNQARRLITEVPMKGERLFVLDLALTETANAIWKRYHQHLIAVEETRLLLSRLLRTPVDVKASTALLASGLEIAVKYDRAVYDSLFVALAEELGLPGVTADEPLWRAVHADFPNIILLRDWQQ